MCYIIECSVDRMLDLEVSPKQPLERLLIRKEDRLQARFKPYVAEAEDGPVEVAALFFAHGTTTRRIRFALFSFVG